MPVFGIKVALKKTGGLMVSEQTLEWREKNKEFIKEWKEKIKELRLRRYSDRWDQDKFEMEILSLINDQELRTVFIFSKNYIVQRKTGKFRKFMLDIYNEIIDYGSINPFRLNSIKRRIETAKRKMK